MKNNPTYKELKYYSCRASDFFKVFWAEVTHGAKNGGSFTEMMDPSMNPQLTFVHTDTDTCMHMCILTADYRVKPVLSGHSKKKTNSRLILDLH